MLRQVLASFELQVDEDLDVMTQGQTLNGLAEQLLNKLDQSCDRKRPDMVLVHGDTTTSFIAALAGRGQPQSDRGDCRSALPTDEKVPRQPAAREHLYRQDRSHRQHPDRCPVVDAPAPA